MVEVLTPSVEQSISYHVLSLHLDWERKLIDVWLMGPSGRVKHRWTGDTATQLMIGLNKANLSTVSLHRRILERLAQDGKIPTGTVSGSPD